MINIYENKILMSIIIIGSVIMLYCTVYIVYMSIKILDKKNKEEKTGNIFLKKIKV